jgi:hypothetical protein
VFLYVTVIVCYSAAQHPAFQACAGLNSTGMHCACIVAHCSLVLRMRGVVAAIMHCSCLPTMCKHLWLAWRAKIIDDHEFWGYRVQQHPSGVPHRWAGVQYAYVGDAHCNLSSML